MRNLLTFLARGGYYFAPDFGPGSPAPSGDAGQPDTGGPPSGIPTDAGVATGEPAAELDDEYDPLISAPDDIDPEASVWKDPRVAKLRQHARKLERRFKKLHSVAGPLRGQNVPEMLAKARQYDQMQQAIQSNPRLANLLYGTPEPERAREPERAAPPPGHEDADAAPMPFDVTDDVGKFFVKHLSSDATTKRAMQERIDRLEQFLGGQQRQTVNQQWSQAVDAAKKELPSESVKRMFHDAVYGAMVYAQQNKLTTKPQQVIDHYLAEFRKERLLSPGTTARASAATAQRIAEGNRTLPRPPVQGGQPASPRADKETVSDVNRRLKRMFGG